MKIYIKLDNSKECKEAIQVIKKNLDVKIINDYIEIDALKFENEKNIYTSIMDICRDYECVICKMVDNINDIKEK